MDSFATAPGPFTQAAAQTVNDIHLTSPDDSKITHVNLYSGRAEITRLFTFPLSAGQNVVMISELPSALDVQSLRVQGRGNATIHDVTVSEAQKPRSKSKLKSKSDALTALYFEREWLSNALSRRTKALTAADAYLDTLNVQHLEFAHLGRAMDAYEVVSEKLSVRITDLRKQLEEIEEEIEEQAGNAPRAGEGKLGLKAAIGVFAAEAGQIDLVLIYAVRLANWNALYEIRVNINEGDTSVMLVYKAAITQSTGEIWENVPLTLETATPTFGLTIPSLRPWSLSFAEPRYIKYKSQPAGQSEPNVRYRRTHYLSDEEYGQEDQYDMQHQQMTVTSKGNVSASFRVPGLVTIPSGERGAFYNVTIAQMMLPAQMSWVSVPKMDYGRVHLEAKVKNSSEYTLLPGNSSVYVDGSFIAQSTIPAVSPEESFHCPLGLDPSIRVTYHPRTKSVSQRRAGLLSGYIAMTTFAFSQRITVYNTKTIPLKQEQLKVIDQVPVSTDERISIKLLNPPLVSSGGNESGGIPDPVREPVKIGEGVIAQWEGAGDLEEGGDPNALGKDGKFYWLCAVPSMGKVDLSLEWEVAVPTGEGDIGL